MSSFKNIVQNEYTISCKHREIRYSLKTTVNAAK